MTTRKYSSRAQQTTLSAPLGSSDVSMTVVSGSNLMGGKTPAVGETFTVVIDPDTAIEEIVDISNYSSGNTLTIARGIDGSSAVAHSAGAVVRHMVIGRDLTESNTHIENTTTAHGLTLANVVETTDSGVVTSTMIANDTIVDADINTAANIAWTKLAPSSTVSATEVGYLDGVTSAIQTQIDTKLATATAASTYAPLASPALTGVPTAPTAAANTNTTQVATTQFVITEINDLIDASPGTLDTLNELAAALGDDPNFATTITDSIATKLPKAGGTMSGEIAMGTNKITGLGTPTVSTDAATKAYADAIVASSPSNLTGPITSTGAATSIASQTGTGTKFVMDDSPTLITPVLGVATATSINGSPIPTSKTLVVTTDKISALSATTSAELAGVISDETGSGALVFAESPTLVTPALGTPSAINLANATVAAGTTSTSDDGVGYMGIPQNATTTGSATVAAADGGKHIYASATRTVTIDSNANLALPVGFTVSFIAGSGATMTIAITTDTMYLAGPGTTGSRTLAPFGMATAVKLTSTTWIISGNGLT